MAMQADTAMEPAARRRITNKLLIENALRRQVLAISRPNARVYTAWLIGHLGLWALGVALIVWLRDAWWAQLLIAIALGSQLHTLTVLQHDCGHQSAYASKRANKWVGRVLAWFIFMPFTTFTELHRFHHGFLGNQELDPDEWFYEGGAKQLFLREMLFMPRFIYLSLTAPYIKADVRRTVRSELAANAVIFAVLIAVLLYLERPDVLVFGFLVPMLLLALLYNPISRGYEHFPMARFAPDDPRRLELSENTITVTSPVVGLLWANITYHVEHHMFPHVPFYRLPALHRLFADLSYRRAKYPLEHMHEVR